MIRILALIAGVLLSLSAYAGGPGEDLLSKLSDCRVSMDFDYESQGEVKVITRGSIVVNGNCYKLMSKGLQVYCDGIARWTVDTGAKEVYIEPAGGEEDLLKMISACLSDVSDINASSDKVSGIWTDPSDGTRVRFAFSSIRTSKLEEGSSGFVYDTRHLDPSWVVTDLR